MAVQEEAKRDQITQTAIRALDTAKTAIDNLIKTLDDAYQSTLKTQRTILDELSRALNAIVSNKSRVNKTFEAEANKFTSQLAQAQKTLATAQKGA